MKAGTFDIYPSHSADPYTIRRSKPTNREPVFRPAPGPKSKPVKSIIMANVNRFEQVLFMFPISLLLAMMSHKPSYASYLKEKMADVVSVLFFLVVSGVWTLQTTLQLFQLYWRSDAEPLLHQHQQYNTHCRSYTYDI